MSGTTEETEESHQTLQKLAQKQFTAEEFSHLQRQVEQHQAPGGLGHHTGHTPVS